jgi:RNA recognition motif-containing protein
MERTRLLVRNLDLSVTREELRGLFANYGEVRRVRIKEGGTALVLMSGESEAEGAKQGLDLSDFRGRILRVYEARPYRFGVYRRF